MMASSTTPIACTSCRIENSLLISLCTHSSTPRHTRRSAFATMTVSAGVSASRGVSGKNEGRVAQLIVRSAIQQDITTAKSSTCTAAMCVASDSHET